MEEVSDNYHLLRRGAVYYSLRRAPDDLGRTFVKYSLPTNANGSQRIAGTSARSAPERHLRQARSAIPRSTRRRDPGEQRQSRAPGPRNARANIAMLHEPGHPEPWIIALSDPPTTRGAADYGLRWGIEAMFSDYKTRGFNLEDSHIERADRLDRLVLASSLALY